MNDPTINKYKVSWFKELIFLIFLIEFVAISGDYILIDDSILFNSLSDSLPYEKILEIVNIRQKYSWIGYITLPFIYTIKILMVCASIKIGIFLQEASKINTNKLFRNIAVFDEFLFFCLPILIKLLWFRFV